MPYSYNSIASEVRHWLQDNNWVLGPVLTPASPAWEHPNLNFAIFDTTIDNDPEQYFEAAFSEMARNNLAMVNIPVTGPLALVVNKVISSARVSSPGTTLGNHLPPGKITINGHVVSPLMTTHVSFDPEKEEFHQELVAFKASIVKCDCGAAKCKTTHAPWCTLYRKY